VGSLFYFDDFELDVDGSELRRGGASVKVHALTLRILDVFVRNPGKLVTKSELFARAWGGRAVSDNSLTVAIGRLRKALDERPGEYQAVLTVHGRGYRFLRDVSIRELPNLAPPDSPQHAPSFVGREGVMAQLRAALVDARRGSGAVIVLSGEGGSGKTRVAEVLSNEALEANFAVVWGYCRTTSTRPEAPLWPFIGLLRELLDRLGPITRDPRLRAFVSDLAQLLPEVSDTGQEPDACLESAPTLSRFAAVVRLLALASEKKPLLLVVDDLHAADAASLELLLYWLPEVVRTRIVVLATARPGHDARLARVLGHRNCTSIAIGPLSHADVASYVTQTCGSVDEPALRAVYQLSGGNAFYVRELARQLRKRTRTAALRVPSAALELMRERLASLSASARDVLTCAAVIGRSFSLPLLQSIAAHSSSELIASLDEALVRDVVAREPGSATEFFFTHELLRLELYEELPAAERRAWHQRIVGALELRQPPIAELAGHAYRALPEGDLRKTVLYCAQAAAEQPVLSDAARWLQRARDALDLMPSASARLRFDLLWRQAFIARAHSTRSFVPLAQQVLHFARELGDAPRLAQAALLLEPPLGFPRLFDSALPVALASLPEDACGLRAALITRLALSAPRAYDAHESSACIAQALRLAEASSELADQYTARSGELYLFGGPAHASRADEALAALQRLCLEHAQVGPRAPMLLELHRALTALQAGEVASAARTLERCALSCRERDLELHWYLERALALVRIQQGEGDDARDALLELQRSARSDEPLPGTELFCAYDQSVVLRSDDRSSAEQRALAPQVSDPPNLWALKVRALAAFGDLYEARNALALVSPERLRRLPCDREYLGTLGALARAALQLCAAEHARVIYELLAPYPEYFAINIAFYCEGSVSHLLGLLARSFGDAISARRHFKAAIAASEKAGFWACAADAQFELSATAETRRVTA
jgi:DNA-binding winged helix-turn-helix (wHTH) protein